MVTILFGNFRHLIEEFHPSHEILDGPVPANSLSRVGQVPATELLELLFRGGQRARIDAAFAGFALLASQLFGGQYLHDRLAFAQGLIMKPLRGFIGGTQRTSIAVSLSSSCGS